MSKSVEWGIIHGEGEIVCVCDYCSNEETIPFDCGPDFREAQREIESYGWFSRKIDGEWYDFCCEECYQAWKKTKE